MMRHQTAKYKIQMKNPAKGTRKRSTAASAQLVAQLHCGNIDRTHTRSDPQPYHQAVMMIISGPVVRDGWTDGWEKEWERESWCCAALEISLNHFTVWESERARVSKGKRAEHGDVKGDAEKKERGRVLSFSLSFSSARFLLLPPQSPFAYCLAECKHNPAHLDLLSFAYLLCCCRRPEKRERQKCHRKLVVVVVVLAVWAKNVRQG